MTEEPFYLNYSYPVSVCVLTVQKTAAALTLDIGEDRVLLETRSNVYRLDIYLPFLLIQTDCVAQFNRRTKVRIYCNHLLIKVIFNVLMVLTTLENVDISGNLLILENSWNLKYPLGIFIYQMLFISDAS